MTKNNNLFNTALIKAIGEVAEHSAIPTYAVGGFVRDLLLGRQGKDIDIVVVGEGPAFARLLADRLRVKNVTVYKKFGTAMIRHRSTVIEVVGARKESYRGDSRNP